MTPSALPGEARPSAAAPPNPPCQGRGGVSLAYIRGWHQGVTASAAVIADPADRCAYLEAQLARLGAALETPCDPR